MNVSASKFMKNFFYTLSSNLISMLVSILVVLIIPKLVSVEDNGYWQLYLFYASYVGFLHFGWNDGIYLRYGGEKYDDLDKSLFFSQFYTLLFSQLIIGISIWIGSTILLSDLNKIYILQSVAICTVIVNVRYMLLYILQATNEIKGFATITLLDRILYLLLILIALVLGWHNYKLMITADLAAKLFSLIFAMYRCRDIIFRSITSYLFNVREIILNISVGIKLMFANVASSLIIGTVRMGIERNWDISTFGKISLTLNVSNFMMLFINAVGVIMFPTLRRLDEDKLPNIYISLRSILMIIMFGILIVYYPLKEVLISWLPAYKSSLAYMALIFPMCVYEGKMALLINTYLKTLRKEKIMLRYNFITVLFSIILTYFATYIFNNLTFSVLLILVLLMFRCVISEIYLSKLLRINFKNDIKYEILLTLIFVFSAWFFKSWIGLTMYILAFLTYIMLNKNRIKYSIGQIKEIINR